MGENSQIVFIETKSKVPREFYIKKEDLEEHGYTRGCGGCSSVFRGLARQPHNDVCRERLRSILKEGARVKNAEGRRKDFEDKELEKKRKKEEKKDDKREEKRSRNEGVEVPALGRAQTPPSAADEQMQVPDAEMSIDEVARLVGIWVNEVEQSGEGNEDEENMGIMQEAWDDVNGGELPMSEVKKARGEEIEYMVNRGIWSQVPIGMCWDLTGKGPTSVRWVDVNKAGEGGMEVRCRLVARDFKGRDTGRDDLFAATPPLEAKRMLLSRAATITVGSCSRKLLFIDAKKAHLNPRCREDVFIELPEECGAGPGICGKLDYWLYGFRKAAVAWEDLYSSKLVESGFTRGVTCVVVFYHAERDISLVVHGDDFTFEGTGQHLLWVADLMRSWFEIKVRALLGPDEGDDKHVVILGRHVRWTAEGIEYEADPKHRKLIMEHFGFDEESSGLVFNGEKDWKKEEEWEEVLLEKDEATVFRGVAARANFLSLDCPDLQFPVKQMSREMAKPMVGSWKRMKKIARYLVNRKRVIWHFNWQDHTYKSHVCGDSDWGGRMGSRKSTSGGVWMIGGHCIKTWSVTQGAYALSSAEAEFYAMIEAVLRAKGLRNLAVEVGFTDLENIVHIGTDSSAAKSFVGRQGLGKMKHLEIRDLWLQKEVNEGKVVVHKVLGTENPSDLGTKILNAAEISERLEGMNLEAQWKE